MITIHNNYEIVPLKHKSHYLRFKAPNKEGDYLSEAKEPLDAEEKKQIHLNNNHRCCNFLQRLTFMPKVIFNLCHLLIILSPSFSSFFYCIYCIL